MKKRELDSPDFERKKSQVSITKKYKGSKFLKKLHIYSIAKFG